MMYLVVLVLCLPAILAQGSGTPTPQFGGFPPGYQPGFPGGNNFVNPYQVGYPRPYGNNYGGFYGNPCSPGGFGVGSGGQQCTQQFQRCLPGQTFCCQGSTCRLQYNSYVCLPSFGFDEAQATDAPADVAANAAV